MKISVERTEQLDVFCRVTGFTSDFLSFIDVELIRFFHGALQLKKTCKVTVESSPPINKHPAFQRPDALLVKTQKEKSIMQCDWWKTSNVSFTENVGNSIFYKYQLINVEICMQG